MTLCMVKLSMLGFYISIRCVMAFISHGTWHTSKTLTGGFLLPQNFCVAISVSPHVCFILVLILISMFLR